MAPYMASKPVDCEVSIDQKSIVGKTAIVTGSSALGIGEAYVRALVAAGAFVVIADLNEEAGSKLHHQFPSSTIFLVCDVTSWESQLSVFKKAKEISPTSHIDIVVANAGISSNDQIYFSDIEKDEPDRPNLQMTSVNVVGVLLTTKLALWYFRKQNANGTKHDHNLVLQGSVTGYVDIYGAPQYTASKFVLRGLMRSLRQSEQAHGIRVNLIAPWYVKTTIITDSLGEAIEKSGAGFATLEDASQALLRIVSDSTIHGRAIAVMPRSWEGAPNGYIDLDEDDFNREKEPWMSKMQEDVLEPVRWIQSTRNSAKSIY